MKTFKKIYMSSSLFFSLVSVDSLRECLLLEDLDLSNNQILGQCFSYQRMTQLSCNHMLIYRNYRRVFYSKAGKICVTDRKVVIL